MSIAIVSAGAAEIVSAGPMRVRILEDGGHTQHRLGVIEVTIPPHVDGPPQHIHHGHEETFYVVSGTPTFTCGAETVHMDAGDCWVFDSFRTHTVRNAGTGDIMSHEDNMSPQEESKTLPNQAVADGAQDA